MLQISSGKFFRPVELYTSRHRGVLYTNYRTHHQIETVAGALRPLEGGGDVAGLLYEADERLEAIAPNGRREFLASVGGDYMIQDFAAVASFSLNVTCTPDVDLARRLTLATRLPLGVPHRPRDYVPVVFDASVEGNVSDGSLLQQFVADLVGLERRTYEAVLRAIRRYVTGLHRIGDDLDLAYTLLVASIESLAQAFDAFTPVWEDYDPQKRGAIDVALTDTGASVETRDRVREAILAQEHVALSRRFREFALAHIGPSFYREEAEGDTLAAPLRDLPGMLERAYRFRSRYVHTLRELPRIMTVGPLRGDVMNVEGEPVLTFKGLARAARHVIKRFVAENPKVEREEFDYRSALPNIVRMPLAESFWLHSAPGYDHESAHQYLSGFLNQLSSALTGVPGPQLTDLSEVMARIEQLVPALATAQQRLPMLVLYGLYHAFVGHGAGRPDPQTLLSRYESDFDSPTIEAMIAHILTSQTIPWPPGVLDRAREEYFTQRRRRRGLLLPPVFEAAVALALAEAYRLSGEIDRTRAMIAEAVENFPGRPKLLALEAASATGAIPTIDWREVLLPPREPDAGAAGSQASGPNDP